ncbi:MAG: polyprenol monophosphomannose synthase [Spirulinaceae cyanobacterium RM2_2_10]|nr:polyprenol monophosphomannose synthase [Spirulinaceae cyanobacterium SM2_1_0]NJO20083.1 polyprenol monophosphomannose synthase [Spirulinaceae cyanobacterium RM2_2_10]
MVYVRDSCEAAILVPPLEALTLKPRQTSLSLSLVLPTYNERQSLPALLIQLTSLLDRLLPLDYELIVVDDDSPDRTWELAGELAQKYPNLRVLRRCGERGLASAVVRGWQSARGEILGVMDADLQHPPATLPALLQVLEQGADLAIASRRTGRDSSPGWPWLRRWLSSGARWLGWLLLPQAVSRTRDPLSGYFLVRHTALVNCELAPVGYKILLEVLSRGHIRELRDVDYTFSPRRAGQSKVTQRHYWDYLRHLWRLRRQTL